MSVFVFQAVNVNPQTGQRIPLAAGTIERFVLNLPDGSNIAQAKAVAVKLGFGNPYVRYAIAEAKSGPHEVLAVQIVLAQNIGASAQPPQLSAQHVNGGQPTGMPTGQPGQDRPPGPVDSSGFQNLADADLGLAGGADMFGTVDEGTISDIIQDGGGSKEVPRYPGT